MRKRRICLAFAMSMAVILGGCSGDKGASVSQESAGTTKASTGVDTSEEVELRIYGIGQEGGIYNEEIMAAINEITKEKINATIDVSMISWSDFSTKIPAILASGEDFDLIYTSTWANFKTEGPKGAYRELTREMLETYMPKTYAEYPEVAWEQGSLNGKVYMIPCVSDQFESHSYLIRGDLRKKYNVPEVKTVEDFELYLDAIKQNEPNMSPIKGTVIENNTTPLTMFMEDNVLSGGVIRSGIMAKYDDPLNASATIYLDIQREVCELMRRWYEKEYISKDILSNQTTSVELFKIGQSGVAFTNINGASGLRKEVLSGSPDWDVEYVDFEEGTKIQRIAYNGNGMAVGRNSKNPERALMLMELIYQDQELYDLIRYGLEGKTYILNEDGSVHTPEVENPAELELCNLAMGIVNRKFERQRADEWEVTAKKKEEYAKISYDNPLILPTYNLESVNAEITAVNNIYDQYELPLRWGVVDPAVEYDALIKRYQDAGIDKIVEVVKQQIAEQLVTE